MFIHDDFLLSTKTARRLYHEVAADLPIIDYHNHLPPEDVAQNTQFRDLAHIWLAGDHYKWRAMRANGVPEELCTGLAEPYEKFLAFARTTPKTLRNPLYHWTHLELKRFFGIDVLLKEDTAPKIWAEANEKLSSPEFQPQGILKRFKVQVICTTDDPANVLSHHQALHEKPAEGFRMYPTYRPDGVFKLQDLSWWSAWVKRLAETSNVLINDLNSLEFALATRHQGFHALGGRLSDHGLQSIPAQQATREEASQSIAQALAGTPLNLVEIDRVVGYLLHFLGTLDAKAGWTKQLHLGALRNVNPHLFKSLGPDTGGDSIADDLQAAGLAQFLGGLAAIDQLPKTIIYNLNPAANYVFATMVGNFMQGNQGPAKLQWGSGWWFLDTIEGMTWQLNALSSTGLLSRFVGMLTDSRSFMSFTRHEYFRRLLCELLGKDVEAGLIPDEPGLLDDLVRGVCYQNACDYLGLELPCY